MKKTISLLFFLLFQAAVGYAQKVEYFIDNQDLGIGNNPFVSVSANVVQKLQQEISTQSLAEGEHWLTLRFLDAQNQVEKEIKQNFIIFSRRAFWRAEWLLDNANPQNLAINWQQSIGKVLQDFSTQNLNKGSHTITVRLYDTNNQILDIYTHTFQVFENEQLKKAEYSIDNGAFQPLPLSSNFVQKINQLIETQGFAENTSHRITVRLINQDDQVISQISQWFYYGILQNLPNLIVNSTNVQRQIDINQRPSISLYWKIRNIGFAPAVGEVKERTYLSRDKILDATDVLIDSTTAFINLGIQDSVQRTAGIKIDTLLSTNFYVLIETNYNKRFAETNYQDNIRSSAFISASIPLLPTTNVWNNYSLLANKGLYARILIPANMAGKTLEIEMDSRSEEADNRIYAFSNDLALPQRYEYVSNTNLKPKLIVKSVKTGILYIFVIGRNTILTQQPNSQSISLRAKFVDFAITNVEVNQSVPVPSITLKISGTDFTPDLQAQMQHTNGQMITARMIEYKDVDNILATFPLTNAPVGSYKMILSRTGQTVEKQDAFKVIAFTSAPSSGSPLGSGSSVPPLLGSVSPTCFFVSANDLVASKDLAFWFSGQSQANFNQVAWFKLHFKNTSGKDMPIPKVLLTSSNMVYMSLKYEEVTDPAKRKDQLEIPLIEKNGSKTVLRAGAEGSVVIYALGLGGQGLFFRIAKIVYSK